MAAADPLAGISPPAGRRLAVRVTPDALRHVRRGHPWLFDASITSVTPGGVAGDLAVVFDEHRRFAAIGLYDPASPIRVRLVHHGRPAPIDEGFWRQRLLTALELRRPLARSDATTGYRCLHGENDGFPGLVLDRYASTSVLKLYTTAWLPHLRTLLPLLTEHLGPSAVVVRFSRATRHQDRGGLQDGDALVGRTPGAPVPFLENGLELEADVVRGQKTGHFLDQRDNRRLVGEHAAGARVLDVFSCTGGFALNAAAGGAALVHRVDQSPAAHRTAEHNLERNAHRPAVRRCRHESTTGDAFEVLAGLARRRARFDVVVLDPPSFAARQDAVPGALRAYGRLTDLGLDVLEPGGLLVQASCSSRVGADELFELIHRRASARGVELRELQRTGHPVDHPIGFPEGAYLKALFARRG